MRPWINIRTSTVPKSLGCILGFHGQHVRLGANFRSAQRTENIPYLMATCVEGFREVPA
jgi:hypothetical protein